MEGVWGGWRVRSASAPPRVRTVQRERPPQRRLARQRTRTAGAASRSPGCPHASARSAAPPAAAAAAGETTEVLATRVGEQLSNVGAPRGKVGGWAPPDTYVWV